MVEKYRRRSYERLLPTSRKLSQCRCCLGTRLNRGWVSSRQPCDDATRWAYICHGAAQRLALCLERSIRATLLAHTLGTATTAFDAQAPLRGISSSSRFGFLLGPGLAGCSHVFVAGMRDGRREERWQLSLRWDGACLGVPSHDCHAASGPFVKEERSAIGLLDRTRVHSSLMRALLATCPA